MVPDCECIRIVCEILNSLNIGDFRIKVNHRQLLNGILEICGVPENLCRTICFSIDRLDKKGWDGVREEMVKEKGISESVSDKIGEYAKLSGEYFEIFLKIVFRLLQDKLQFCVSF